VLNSFAETNQARRMASRPGPPIVRPDLLTNRFYPIPKEPNMKDHVYKLIELTGTSTTSIEDAVEKAIKRAHKTIKNLCWFQVVETRGNINKGKVQHWQVTIKVGFTVED
jgi:flavin-binding protein dodecin